MNYYIIKNNFSEKGVPSLLHAVLAENYNKENPMPPMSGYSWTKTRDPNRVYPKELHLVSKDKLYKFDYIQFWNGYVISKKFKESFDAFSFSQYKIVSLKVLGWKGKSNTDKEYFFMDIPNIESLDCIDYENSEFELDEQMINLRGLSLPNVQKTKNYFGNIKEYSSLVIKEPINKDVFQIKDNTIHDLVCSEKFKEEIIKHNFYGINFIRIRDMESYYSYFR